jgi:hypothetical protein
MLKKAALLKLVSKFLVAASFQCKERRRTAFCIPIIEGFAFTSYECLQKLLVNFLIKDLHAAPSWLLMPTKVQL